MIEHLLALALLLAAYGWFLRGDSGAWRRRFGLAWARIIRSFAVFALPSLMALLLLGRPTALVTMPGEFVAWAGVPAASNGPLTIDVAIGLALGTLIGAIWADLRRRRGKAPAMFGDFSTVLPRRRNEALASVATALTAAVTEELYFRLALPLLITIVFGSAGWGFAIATLLFAAAHRYQGWRGVVATGLVGMVLAAVYLMSGALWLAVAAHACINLNALLLRPWIGGQLRR